MNSINNKWDIGYWVCTIVIVAPIIFAKLLCTFTIGCSFAEAMFILFILIHPIYSIYSIAVIFWFLITFVMTARAFMIWKSTGSYSRLLALFPLVLLIILKLVSSGFSLIPIDPDQLNTILNVEL